MTERPTITTLGELRASGYRPRTVKEELRANLVARLRGGEPLMPGILGYDDTVLPQIENAVLAGQDIILLGERGQAKSRIARSLIGLLDAWLPVVAGAELHDDPLLPVSPYARALVAERGDETPVAWLAREDRYGEKLATPDITIADLVGEVDPVKVAEGRYLSDELTIHYGLLPRTNRGIFALNELPDLAERIQVGLFNIMEERDIQIRGYQIRLNLDVFLVSSANPEDYTNRGRIITPLKDRYGVQIRTHYPKAAEHEIGIMEQERMSFADDEFKIVVPQFMKEVVVEI
ncbi:MAG TPA: magnesium chelatase, partial [Candidatus Limnocylindria bacterium]